MNIAAFAGVVENGQIRLETNIRLPEQTRVYVLVPNLKAQPTIHIVSPRLVHRKQTADFRKEIVEATPDADV